MHQQHSYDSGALVDQLKQILDSKHRYSARVARFVLVLTLRLASSPDAPLSASDYVARIHEDAHDLTAQTGGWLGKADKEVKEDMVKAVANLERAAERYAIRAFLPRFSRFSIRIDYFDATFVVVDVQETKKEIIIFSCQSSEIII